MQGLPTWHPPGIESTRKTGQIEANNRPDAEYQKECVSTISHQC